MANKVAIVTDSVACIPKKLVEMFDLARLALEMAKEALPDEISSQFDCAELFITEFTQVMGVHTGPEVVGIALYSGD